MLVYLKEIQLEKLFCIMNFIGTDETFFSRPRFLEILLLLLYRLRDFDHENNNNNNNLIHRKKFHKLFIKFIIYLYNLSCILLESYLFSIS